MRFKRREVLCSNCGFLGWLTEAPDGSLKTDKLSECRPYARESVKSGEFDGEEKDPETGGIYKMSCLRQQWVLAPGLISYSKRGLKYVNINAVQQPRQCPYYIDYQPGSGPEEHKELKREAETTRAIRRANLTGVAIGASAAIIAQLLYVLLKRGG